MVEITFLVALPKSKASTGWPFMIMAGDQSLAEVRMTIISEYSAKTGQPTDMMLEKGMEIVNGVSVGEHNPYVPVRELGTVEQSLDYRGTTITTTVYRVGGGDQTQVKFTISQKALGVGLRRGLELCRDDARWKSLTEEVRCGHSRRMEEQMWSLTVSAPWLGAA